MLQLEWNSHQFFIVLYIYTFYSTSWKIFPFFSTWKMSAASPVLWHLLWKIFLYSPGKVDCSSLGWYISLLQCFILTYKYSFTYMSALRLNCQLLTVGLFLFISVFPPPSIMPFIVGILWKADWYILALIQSFRTIICLQWDDIWFQTAVYALCCLVFPHKIKQYRGKKRAQNLGMKQDLFD